MGVADAATEGGDTERATWWTTTEAWAAYVEASAGANRSFNNAVGPGIASDATDDGAFSHATADPEMRATVEVRSNNAATMPRRSAERRRRRRRHRRPGVEATTKRLKVGKSRGRRGRRHPSSSSSSSTTDVHVHRSHSRFHRRRCF